MSKLTDTEVRIAELKDQLETAQIQHTKNLAALSTTTDSQAVEAARHTAAQCENLSKDLAMFEDARSALIGQREGESGTQRRLKASELAMSVKGLLEQRNIAAHQVDQALETLRQAMDQWTQTSAKAHEKAGAFYRVLFEGDHVGMQRYAYMSGGLADSASNAIVAQLDEALRGINCRSHIAFNYIQRRHDQRELVKDAAQDSANTMISTIESVAFAEGVKL